MSEQPGKAAPPPADYTGQRVREPEAGGWTKADRAAYDRLIAERHIAERYGASVVVVACEHCHVSYERERGEGRTATIRDRRAAVEHARTVHGVGA